MHPVLSQLNGASVDHPLVVIASSKSNDVIYELDLLETIYIVNITEPSKLFQLISGGDFVIKPVTDAEGNEIVLACRSSAGRVCPLEVKLKAEPKMTRRCQMIQR